MTGVNYRFSEALMLCSGRVRVETGRESCNSGPTFLICEGDGQRPVSPSLSLPSPFIVWKQAVHDVASATYVKCLERGCVSELVS